MTPEQIGLIRASFAEVMPIADQAAALFYGRVFELAPEVRPLFRGDMKAQGAKLMAALATVVNGLDRLEAIMPVVQDLAKRHVAYGVKPEHYAPVGAALLWTLDRGLGEAFTPEITEAWTAAYAALSGAMIAAAIRRGDVSPDTGTFAQRLVIIGAGMVAARLIAELAARCPGKYAVTILGAEPHRPYNRILLSPLLAGERRPEDLFLEEAQALPAARFHLDDPVVSLDRVQRVAITRTGARHPYDHLVLAVGSEPIRPPLPEIDLPGVFTFRDRRDAEALIAASETAARAVIVGGGLLGLEAACGLARHGVRVTVVHLARWLMERQLDAAAGALLRQSIEERGIEVILAAESEAVLGDDRAAGVRLKTGRILSADLVVFAIGVRPSIALARDAGLAVRRGILVDDGMTTSDPAILAVGECVEHRGVTYGLVAPLWEQAEVAASRLAGDEDCRYLGTVPATNLKVTGVELFSAGAIEPGAGGEEITYRDPEAGIYRKLVVQDGRLAGAVLLGDARDGAWYAELMRNAAAIGPMRSDLVFGRDFIEAADVA